MSNPQHGIARIVNHAGPGKVVVCWCALCKAEHYVYPSNGVWLVYNCPHFLSYHHLQTYFKNPKNKVKKKKPKPTPSKLAQYPGTQQQKPKHPKPKDEPKKKKKKKKKEEAAIEEKEPKTHWQVDIEDISTGEL